MFCSFEAFLFILYTSIQKLGLDPKLFLFKTLSNPLIYVQILTFG